MSEHYDGQHNLNQHPRVALERARIAQAAQVAAEKQSAIAAYKRNLHAGQPASVVHSYNQADGVGDFSQAVRENLTLDNEPIIATVLTELKLYKQMDHRGGNILAGIVAHVAALLNGDQHAIQQSSQVLRQQLQNFSFVQTDEYGEQQERGSFSGNQIGDLFSSLQRKVESFDPEKKTALSLQAQALYPQEMVAVPVPSDSTRPAFHKTAYASVLKKIQLVYGLSDTDVKLPDSDRQTIATKFQTYLNTQKWRECIKNAATSTEPDAAPDSEKIAAILACAEHIMLDYAEAFTIQAAINKPSLKPDEDYKGRVGKQTAKFYARQATKTDLTEILINHVSNTAEKELCSIGLSAEVAHQVHGRIIGTSVKVYKEEFPETHPHVMPMLDHNAGAVESTIKTTSRTSKIADFWQEKREGLGKGFGNAMRLYTQRPDASSPSTTR